MVTITARAKDTLLQLRAQANMDDPELGLRLEADNSILGLFPDWQKPGDQVVGVLAIRSPREEGFSDADVDLAKAVQIAGMKNGLMLLTAGFYNNCIRLLPPINIPLALMDTAFDLLEDSLGMALAGKAS